MEPKNKDAFVHVIASVDLEKSDGKIRYVLPSQVKTATVAQKEAGANIDDVWLVAKAADGSEIQKVRAELRFEACDHDEKHRRAIIQQDIPVTNNLSEIELIYGNQMLDAYRPTSKAGVLPKTLNELTLGSPAPGEPHRMSLGASNVPEQSGVSYTVQAKPDNGEVWQTIAVGQPKPEFSIDKNQFPGARQLAVRVVQNAGFSSQTIDERTVKLD